jgi:hypothetical protein
MTQSRFHKPEIIRFASLLSVARKPSDLSMAEAVLGRDSYGIDAMVSFPFYEAGSYFPSFTIPSTLQREYIVPYLCHPYVYFINHEPLIRPSLRIDYTVTFDTNFASYINRFVRGESLKEQQDEFMHVINDVLDHDLNFDSSFYFVENIKKAHPIALRIKGHGPDSPQMFWELLDEGFRHNIVSLELFRGVDCGHYRKTRELKFDVNIVEAVRKSVGFTHWFYASTEGQQLISDFFFTQKVILLQLLGILRVQFSSSRGARNKIKEFLELVQEKLVYSDRETIVAHKYFKDRKMLPLLEKVNRGGVQRRLMEKIDNLAWDMTAPWWMERMAAFQDGGDYTVPFFLTFDQKLRQLIKCYPVKAVIIDRRSGGVLSIPELNTREYFVKEGCKDVITSFFSEENQRQRFSREVPTLEILSDMVNCEYRELRAILGLNAEDLTR